MSETREQPTGIAWGDPISPERLAELKEMFERQKAWAAQPDRNIEQSVFYEVKLTGADVFWLAAMAVAEPGGDPDTGVSTLHALQQGIATLTYYIGLHLEGVNLYMAQLEQATLNGAHLEDANLGEAQLKAVDLPGAHLERANLHGAYLEDANLTAAHLERADLHGAQLKGADLRVAELQGAELTEARLESTNISEAYLERADLRGASFDKASRIDNVKLDGVSMDRVIFDNTNLTVVPWEMLHRLGDEREARKTKRARWKAETYHTAARAYRSLSVALRNQGLGTDATRFHYRAELMERKSYFWQIFARLRSLRFYTAPAYFGRWLFSWLLGTFAGYGDYFGRLLLTYVIVVSAFAGLMFLASGRVVSFDSIRDVFVLSITSFHGRGVQPPGLHLNDGLATLTAVEAFFGLLIEGIFIAAFTRRVTGN